MSGAIPSHAGNTCSEQVFFRKARRRWRRRFVRLGRRLGLVSPRPSHQRLDLLYGLAAIARYMNLSKNQTRALIIHRAIPCFELGGVICARQSSILRHVKKLERDTSSPEA